MEKMKERFNNFNAVISSEVLAKLPGEPVGMHKDKKGTLFVATVLEKNQDDSDIEAVIVIWVDKGKFMPGCRKAYFSLDKGEYLGDAFLVDAGI